MLELGILASASFFWAYYSLELLIFCQIFQDQMRALDVIRSDPELSSLELIQSPLVDMEIRGVPALKFMGDIIWK